MEREAAVMAPSLFFMYLRVVEIWLLGKKCVNLQAITKRVSYQHCYK